MFRVRVKEPLINIKNRLNFLFYKCVIFSLFICIVVLMLFFLCGATPLLMLVLFFSRCCYSF
jgi:magnesium-transporting ATPase (P-type)